MTSKTVYFISAAIFMLGILLGVGATYVYITSPENSSVGGIACTMDAKICPDGTSVGRTGPNCEFAPCDGSISVENSDTVVSDDGAGVLPGSDGTEPGESGGGGNIACPADAKLCPNGTSVGRSGPNCEFEDCPIGSRGEEGTAGGSACTTNSDCASGYECIDPSPVIREGYPGDLTCWKIGAPRPICLSGETKISTPTGDVLVKNMKEGMAVWTTNKTGKKVSGTVILTGKTAVPSTHKVMHIKLSDGRELFVSPGHKIADGRTAGQIILGDTIDNAIVILASLVSYTEKYTYDILPSGSTGMYFANGILLQSTLR